MSQSTRILVFPDLHQAPNLEQIDEVISRVHPDLTVFLGDYFDQFGDSYADAERTALWLKSSLHTPGRIHLIGNHDIQYLRRRKDLRCTGYSDRKARAIRKILDEGDIQRLRFHVWVGGYLLTHAGLTRQALRQQWPSDTAEPAEVAKLLQREDIEAQQALGLGRRHWYWATSPQRGGVDKVSGILWADFDWEFEPIPGLNQIVGHSRGEDCRRIDGPGSTNYCIDTADRSGWHHYLVLDGRIARIYRSDGTPDEAEEITRKGW